MNKNRVILLVVFMFCTSLLLAFSFADNTEEGAIDNITSLSEIKVDQETKEIEHISAIEDESQIMVISSETVKPAFDEIEAIEDYFAQKIVEEERAQADINERITRITELTPLDDETASIVIEYADRYNLEASLILGMMDLESNFRQYLVGTSDDRGYMQIIPGTEKWLATAYGKELGLVYDTSQIFEPEYNIPLAVKYLALLEVEFEGNRTMMLTAYNRGTGGMRKWYRNHGTYETAYSRVILKRTQKYTSVD